jgi:hypothetical protein
LLSPNAPALSESLQQFKFPKGLIQLAANVVFGQAVAILAHQLEDAPHLLHELATMLTHEEVHPHVDRRPETQFARKVRIGSFGYFTALMQQKLAD